MKVKRYFKGLRESDAQPHLLENFREGAEYDLFYEDGFRYTMDDKGNKIMITNQARKTYFY